MTRGDEAMTASLWLGLGVLVAPKSGPRRDRSDFGGPGDVGLNLSGTGRRDIADYGMGRAMSSKYAKLADEFIARIHTTKLTGTTDVALIFYFCDANGQTSRRRESIIQRLSSHWPSPPPKASEVHDQGVRPSTTKLLKARQAIAGDFMTRDSQ